MPRSARVRTLGSLALAAVMVLAGAGAAHAQDGSGSQSVKELKAALAELRRRLEEEKAGEATLRAEQKLRAARLQVDRLVGAIEALRHERDGLRAALVAARAELAGRSRRDVEAERRLAEAQAEITRLQRQVDAEAAPPTGPMLPAPATLTEVVDGSSFPPGSAVIKPEAIARLAAIAGQVRDHPGAAVSIVGHTDASGDEAGNRRLSLARAKAVRSELARLGAADLDRFEVDGQGERDPIASNDTAEGRIANRRVVVTIEP